MATRTSLITKAQRILAVSGSFNASIEEAIDEAMQYLVRNYDFAKSLRYVELEVLEGTRLLTLPIDVKRIRFVAYSRDGLEYPILGASPDTFPVHPGGVPRKYFRDNVNQLFLDVPVPANGSILLRYYSKTGEGTTEGGVPNPASTWLPEDYPDAVLFRALITVAPEVRKPEIQQMYIPLWTEQLQNLVVEQHENEYSNTTAKMEYQPLQADHASRYPVREGI